MSQTIPRRSFIGATAVAGAFATTGTTRAAPRARPGRPRRDGSEESALLDVQTVLLGPRSAMDDIAAAIRKIHVGAADLARA